jgi:hypothetical protein
VPDFSRRRQEAGTTRVGRSTKALLFLKKKKQKDFFNSGPRALETPGHKVAKTFCAAFFQKSG